MLLVVSFVLAANDISPFILISVYVGVAIESTEASIGHDTFVRIIILGKANN